MNTNTDTRTDADTRIMSIDNPLTTPKYSVSQQVVMFAAVAVACLAYANPATAQVLAPVERSSGIIRDTIVGICLAGMTGAWGFAGLKMAFAGATLRDSQGPLIGGTIAGGAAAMAAAFIS